MSLSSKAAQAAKSSACPLPAPANQERLDYVEGLAREPESAHTLALFAREFEFAHPDVAILALAIATADDLRFLADAQSAPSTASPAVMERTLYRLAARIDTLAELVRRSIGGAL